MNEMSRRATTGVERASRGRRSGRDEFVDEGAGIGLRERRAGGAEVAQPAEAVEGLAPGLARRHEIEGERPPVASGRPAKTKKPA